MNLFFRNSSFFKFTNRITTNIYFIVLLLSVIFSCCARKSNEATPTVEVIPTPERLRSLGSGEYYLRFENFPKNKEIILTSTKTVQRKPNVFTTHETFILDENDWISVNGSKDKATHFSMPSRGYAPGERVKIRFSDRKGKLIAQTSYIPKPIQTKSQEGTFSISAELAISQPETYIFTLDRIPSGEKVHLHFVSTHEVVDSDFTQGKIPLIYSPRVMGQNSGHSIVEISRENGDKACLCLQYGKEIAHEILKDFEKGAKQYADRVASYMEITNNNTR